MPFTERAAAILCQRTGQKVPPANSRLPKQGRQPSVLETRFADALRDFGADLPPAETEYPWLPGRQFKSDFAFPEFRLLIEIEGGCHMARKRFEGDCRKNNLMLLHGWRLLRFCAAQLDASERGCVDEVRQAFERREMILPIQFKKRIFTVHKKNRCD